MSERVNPMDELNDIKVEQPNARSVREAADKVAAAVGFPSRQAPRAPAPKPPQRRHTTGRNVQIPIKATAETRERMAAMADRLQAPYGEVLARALASLERELALMDT
ncbi:hypothetical protein OKW30_003559 [Paraburkholderia sp. Clong3]|uniref:hypothetical protein n=1 Tax=Paraburkholderia sp. Clong3 TaxID=2991061 RepID=UPI003D1F5817